MSTLQRFLSFVPPILLFVFPAISQIQGTLTQLPGSNTYQVSIIPTQDIALPMSSTSSAQITLRAKSGKLNLINFQSLTGDWEMQSQYISPDEAPDQDYFRFFLINPIPTITYTSGVEVPLFTFDNDDDCTLIELVDNDTDPFVSNNSLMVDARNYFSIILVGPGGNAYEGNTANASVTCPQLDLVVSANNNPVACNGDLTNLTVTAIDGNEPYTVVYSHSTSGVTSNATIAAFEGSATFFNLPAGQYEITITDSKDSTAQTNYLISQPAPLVVDLEPAPATCDGSFDGAVRVSGVSGLGGPDFGAYQYFWDVDPNNSNVELDSLQTGTYTVTVVDGNGCTTAASTFVDIFHQLFIQKTIIDISCYGENNGIIDITPFGVAPPYEYSWSPNANTGNESAAWMLGPGDYHVTVTAAEVCTQVETFTIVEPGQLSVDYELVDPECFGDDAFLNILNIENDQGGFDVEILGNHTPITDSLYIVDAGVPIQFIITDGMGCEISDDFLIPEKQELTVDLGEDVTIKYGESVDIHAEVFPLTGVDLEWRSDEWLDCSNCPNPTATPLENITYVLSITDSNGCFAEDALSITVNKSRDIYIPNAFSPNKDGINDFFRPFGGFEIIEIQSLMVFNRWGGLVYLNDEGFTLDVDDAGWNGTANGKDLDPGTYLYSMNVEFIDGEIVLFSGEVNLIK